MEMWLQVEERDKRDMQNNQNKWYHVHTHEKILKKIILPGEGKKSRLYTKNRR